MQRILLQRFSTAKPFKSTTLAFSTIKPTTPPVEVHEDFKKEYKDFEGQVNPESGEVGGPKGKEPTRY